MATPAVCPGETYSRCWEISVGAGGSHKGWAPHSGQAGPVGVLRQRLWVQENVPEAPLPQFVMPIG